MFARFVVLAVPTLALAACGSSPKVGTTEVTSSAPRPSPVSTRENDAARIVRGGVADNGHKIPIETAAYATCVAVVPEAFRAGVFPAGDHHGVVSCRKGERWSTPGFFILTTGAPRPVDPNARDLVMLLDAEDGNATFGSDIERAGHHVMTCYAHGRGEFAGVQLGGVFIKPDPASMRTYYGEPRRLQDVLGEPARSGGYPGVIGDTFGWARAAFLPSP